MGKVFSFNDFEVSEYVIDHIKQNLIESNITDEEDYYDQLHISIDDWIVGSTGEAKDLVCDYGVLDAIRLYKDYYGEFILDDDDNKVYMTLCYCIINEWFDTYYGFDELKQDMLNK